MITNKHSYPTIEEGNYLHQVAEVDKATMISQPLQFESQNYIILGKDSVKHGGIHEEGKDFFAGFDFNPNDSRKRSTVYLP
jgi:hypothetical protein